MMMDTRILWEHGGVSLTGTAEAVARRIEAWADPALRGNGLRALSDAMEHPAHRAECGSPPLVVRVTIA